MQLIYWRGVSKENLDPTFLADVEELLVPSPYHWYVTHAFRTLEKQAKLYERHKAGGPLAAPPGRSAHNYGLAIDVVLDADPNKPGLQPTWNTKLSGWLWLKNHTLSHPRLQNGWSFHDWPHIQRYRWQRFI